MNTRFSEELCLTNQTGRELYHNYAEHLSLIHISTPRWGEQAILLCMVYMALISASLAVRTDTHIRVMLIDYLLPKRAIGFLKAMSHVMIFGFSLFMIIYGIQFLSLIHISTATASPMVYSPTGSLIST